MSGLVKWTFMFKLVGFVLKGYRADGDDVLTLFSIILLKSPQSHSLKKVDVSMIFI